MKTDEPMVWRLLRSIGCRKREDYFILDEFSCEFYLLFDAAEDPETPEAQNTVDIYVAEIGAHPKDSDKRLRVRKNCGEVDVLTFMLGLGLDQYQERTRGALLDACETVGTRAA